MHVDIVIPTLLKNPEMLQRCLVSVQKLKTDHSIELIIVGNVSEQELYQFRDTFDAVRFSGKVKELPKITFHWRALGSNYGFTGAVNEGVHLGTSPLIVLLNDDTEVTPNWLDELLSVQLKTSAAMVACHILLAKTKAIDSLGFTFLWRGKAIAIQDLTQSSHDSNTTAQLPSDHWLKFPELVTNKTKLNQHQSIVSEPFGPDAAAALYTRELWEELGGMNQSFFAYLEDVDFALRAQLLGHKCALAKDAVVYHHKHATSAQFSGFKAKQDMMNWWRIALGSYPRSAWYRFAGMILAERVRNVHGLLKSRLKS
jgi:GT2 family glycosyltransferase